MLYNINHLSFPSISLLILLTLPLSVSATHKQATTTTITSPPPAPSDSPQYISDSLFTSAVLNSTNTYRAQHSAAELKYNNTLSRFSTSYLAKVKSSCIFAHSGGPYGENLAIGYPDVVGSIDAWGGERREYDYDRADFDEKTGHFTQLVWKNTTTVGCGRVDCGEGKGWYLVCEYWPRGNVIGAFGEMVGRPVEGVDVGSGALVVRGRSCVVLVVSLFVGFVLLA
ncbi:CAP domain-containing protein [Coniochaeta sp. 2T2.1]|nr:CAP domain-containing protein [Coniochaeta sp. 2T2.1]